MTLPVISINIATYNEEKNISRCLRSIFAQDYPREKIEVLIVDGGSKDRTLEIAAQFPVRIIHNPRRTGPYGRTLGFLNASGEYHMYLDADMEIRGEYWLRRMVAPLIDDSTLAASFPMYGVDKFDSPLNRYFSYHKAQLTPMLELFSTPIESTIVSRKEGYSICAFPKERPPLVGIMLFRMSILKDVLVGKDARWEWIDPDVGLLAVRQGHQRFAFVPAVVYHHSYLSIGLLSRKIRRDVTQTFLPYVSTRLTTYLNFGNSREVAEYFAWVVYANTFLPEFVRGVLNSIRVRDWACVYRPLVAVMVADLPIIIAVTRPEGRHFIRQVVRSWVTSHRARKRRGMNATGKRLRPLL